MLGLGLWLRLGFGCDNYDTNISFKARLCLGMGVELFNTYSQSNTNQVLLGNNTFILLVKTFQT